MKRLPLLLLTLALLASACTDRDAPKPVPVPDRDPAADATRPLSSRETAPPPVPAAAFDPEDPAEAGISDLARLARYVFKTMQRHEDVCPFGNPFRDRLHFAIATEVKAGRMVRVGLGHVGVEPEKGGGTRTLAESQWPRELAGYVSCLAPHLGSVTMSPAPADGTYEPAYSFEANPAGRPAP